MLEFHSYDVSCNKSIFFQSLDTNFLLHHTGSVVNAKMRRGAANPKIGAARERSA